MFDLACVFLFLILQKFAIDLTFTRTKHQSTLSKADTHGQGTMRRWFARFEFTEAADRGLMLGLAQLVDAGMKAMKG